MSTWHQKNMNSIKNNHNSQKANKILRPIAPNSQQINLKRSFASHANPIPEKSLSKSKASQYNGIINHSLQILLQQNNMTLYELLNSSITQFTKHFMVKEEIQAEHQQLIVQNISLKTSIQKLKNILRDKLESGLKKQLVQINLVMSDYMDMINKLLKDKEMLTHIIEQLTQKNEELTKQNGQLKQKTLQVQNNKEKKENISQQMIKIEKKHDEITQQFNLISNKYKNRIKSVQKLDQNLQQQLNLFNKQSECSLLNQLNKKPFQISLDSFQKAQQQIINLKQQLNQCQKDKKQAVLQLEMRIDQLQRQHELQFEQYEQAMRYSLNTKDKKIQMLEKDIKNCKLKSKLNPQNIQQIQE